MATLARRIPCSGFGTRIPVRVEDVATGRAVALLTAGQDGTYSVDVPAGRYRVVERWGESFEVEVGGVGSFDVAALASGEQSGAQTPTRAAPSAEDMARTLARHMARQRRED